jgi:hypothetical protein
MGEPSSSSSSSKASKRKAFEALHATVGGSRGGLLKVLDEVEAPDRFHPQDKNHRRDLRSLWDIDTPYGPIWGNLQFETEDTGNVDFLNWPHINPLADLYHACSISPWLSALLKPLLGPGQPPIRLVLYMDESVAGDPLRFGTPRKTQNVGTF